MNGNIMEGYSYQQAELLHKSCMLWVVGCLYVVCARCLFGTMIECVSFLLDL